MKNKLKYEKSLYLLQHADNPVNWFPWGKDAFSEAKSQNKPIFLSIGYSSCHWCHVMAHESFENDEIAEIINKLFIPIKVDREERPDIDSVYMLAIQVMTGHGGWPLTAFLTPTGKPFFGGTYFPPDDRPGHVGIKKILRSVSSAYHQNINEITEYTEKLIKTIQKMQDETRYQETIQDDILTKGMQSFTNSFDHNHGGTGYQPKFPQPPLYEFLLKYHLREKNQQAYKMTDITLKKMQEGGIYDQIGGGFHRYSTDMSWTVPHFEKMLYDNALLIKLYTHAYQINPNEFFRETVTQTLDYVIREMMSKSGGFYSSQDADSDGTEGKFFVWSLHEINSILEPELSEIAKTYFNITAQGNFEGFNILTKRVPIDQVAAKFGITRDECKLKIIEIEKILFQKRKMRVHPLCDTKIIASWNGLMLSAFAEAGIVFKCPEYIQIAKKNANFLLSNMVADNDIYRIYNEPTQFPSIKGYLEDYAFIVSSLFTLHEVTLETKWLKQAINLGNQMIALFWDNEKKCFKDTNYNHEILFANSQTTDGNVLPSSDAVATEILIKMAILLNNDDLRQMAQDSINSKYLQLIESPLSNVSWLSTIDSFLSMPTEILIIGDKEKSKELLQSIYHSYLPNRLIIGLRSDQELPFKSPLFTNKTQINDLPTAFVCQNYVCDTPTNDPIQLQSTIFKESNV